MNVLIVASWYPMQDNPLAGVFFQERAQALAKQGCEVTVFATDIRFRLGNLREGVHKTYNQGVTEYRYIKRNLTPFSERGIAYQQIFMLKKLYREAFSADKRPDILHLEGSNAVLGALAIARPENIPMTYTEHSSAVLNSKEGSFKNMLMKKAAQNAAHCFFISSAIKNKIEPYCKNGCILPNSIQFEPFTLAPHHDVFTFCALGALRKIKGYDNLLRAFKCVAEKYPASRLVIGGAGEELQNLKELRHQLSLEKSVDFLGKIAPENRNEFYNNASAFVCASDTETFSIATVEALACGLPVVSTKCGGPEDILHKDNGILVEKNDVESLANGLLQMVQNRDAYLPEEIRKDAQNRYGESAVVNRQIECFEHVINK